MFLRLTLDPNATSVEGVSDFIIRYCLILLTKRIIGKAVSLKIGLEEGAHL
jgi:hypothetical protein